MREFHTKKRLIFKLNYDIFTTDYLAGEKTSPIRHEYLGGEMFAMSGGTEEHNRFTKVRSQKSEVRSEICLS